MYGLILVTSLIACAFLAQKTVIPENRDLFWKLVFYMLICGVIGARLYHVIHFASYYIENPVLIIKIWHGGLGIIGGLFGALIALVLVLVQEKKTHTSLYWLDIFTFFAPLAQSAGRFGNLANRELLPFALYESIGSATIFLFFLIMAKLKFKKTQGFYLGTYLICYGILRLFLEPFKQDPWKLGTIYTAQIFSVLFIILGTGILNYVYTKD